jgi:beta-glucosidase
MPNVRGFQGERIGASSVLAVIKHFPGDGPVEGGMDPHQAYGRFQVYPAKMLDYHLKPFKAGIAAGSAFVMPGYAIPKGMDTVAMNFSKKIVTGLLREQLGFNGIVLSDWLHAMPWGVETLTKEQRERRMIEAGVDQFGGEHEPGYVIDLVKKKEVSEVRLDESMRRILQPMFELGIFENPYVDPAQDDQTVNSPAFRAAGDAAQRRAVVLLKNQDQVLPLSPGAKLQLVGFDQAPATFAGRTVASAVDADVVVVKVARRRSSRAPMKDRSSMPAPTTRPSWQRSAPRWHRVKMWASS